jgi:BR serine/threonine kinase
MPFVADSANAISSFPMLHPERKVGDYVLQRSLGTGSIGKVKLARHKFNGKQAAIKIIRKATFEGQPNFAIKIRREVSVLRVLNHPHLVGFVDACESSQHVYIIFEYAEHGELFSNLLARGPLSVGEGMHFFRQIIYGLEFLHLHGICHRALQPENILLDKDDNIKIGDFGFTRWMRHRQDDLSCGLPHYAAPELFTGSLYDGRKADVWAAGVILYALLSGTLPFDDRCFRVLIRKVKLGQYRMPDFPAPVKDLITQMLEVHPTKRISIAQIKESEVFREGLPPGYVLPTPQPIPALIEPIDPEALEQSTLDTMIKFGYESRSELFEDLLSKEPTIAKVFVAIHTNRLPGLDDLPWRFGEGAGVGEHATDMARFMVQGAEVDQALMAQGIDGSAATRTIEVSVTLERLMFAIQDFLNRGGLAWFHPHERRIIARSQLDPPLDLTFDAKLGLKGGLVLEVKLDAGPPSQFAVVASEIVHMVAHIND